MVAVVPSLEGQLYIQDPITIIAYVIRRYSRTPKDTVPLLSDIIISLPWQVARFGRQPDALVNNISSDLNNTFARIFGSDRKVTAAVTWQGDGPSNYTVTIAVMYQLLNGETDQTGVIFPIINGVIAIPQDNVNATGKALLLQPL